ncbi:indole-3-glycerol phosphate synthase TrpC [Rhodopirellula sp.]|nr:indole-3-glycerol phosphate synthase TrpC [Rhodopirellula sp.]
MTILDKIIVETRKTIEADRGAKSGAALESLVRDLPPCRDFHAALAVGEAVQLIAEVKRASPSAGLIREDFDPVQIARSYAESGAACISVLTDAPFFQGSLDYLVDIRQAVDLPLLRKDFIIDRYQLLQARAAGADCVLLIAECLTSDQLLELHDQAFELGMQTLIELFDPANLPAVLATGTRLVGVNNRNLHTFETSLDHTLTLRPEIPEDRLLVGESGIRTHQDVQTLGAGGVKGILVGESLMRQPDIGLATRKLLGTAR